LIENVNRLVPVALISYAGGQKLKHMQGAVFLTMMITSPHLGSISIRGWLTSEELKNCSFHDRMVSAMFQGPDPRKVTRG